MKTIQFKTNIKCGGCIAKATPFLDNTIGAANWTVDTNVPEKILTVQNENIAKEDIIAAVKEAGFVAEQL